MFFFTSDEHYDHKNIIRYCHRPFANIEEMNDQLIKNHNRVVGKGDTVIHAGDFTLRDERRAAFIIKYLNGSHIFLKGSHDRWLPNGKFLWERKIEGVNVVVCHYPMRSWPRSYHGSWQFYGHVHGRIGSFPNQYEIGVDTNEFTPISFEEIRKRIKIVEEGIE